MRIAIRSCYALAPEPDSHVAWAIPQSVFTREGNDGSNDSPGDVPRLPNPSGAPRRRPNILGVLNVLMPSGMEYARGNRELMYSTARAADGGRPPPEVPDPAKVAEAEAAADGIFRVWGRGTSPEADVPTELFTERAPRVDRGVRPARRQRGHPVPAGDARHDVRSDVPGDNEPRGTPSTCMCRSSTSIAPSI